MNRNLTDTFRTINLRLTADDKFIYTRNGREMVKDFTLTLDEANRQFAEKGYVCPYDRYNKDVYMSYELENHAIPYMNFIYYFYIWENMAIPSLDEYVDKYIEYYCNKMRNNMYTFKYMFDSNPITFTKEELIGRLSRSYNSFNREIQSLLEFKKYPDLDVEYDFKDDLLRGIDLSIWRGDRYFGVASYVKTSRSIDWKENYKNTTRHDYSDIEMIDLKAELGYDSSSCYTVNGIKLYRPSFIDKIYKERIIAT